MLHIYSNDFIKSKKSEFDKAEKAIQSQMEFEIRISETDCGSAVKLPFYNSLQDYCNAQYKNGKKSKSKVVIYEKKEGKTVQQYREIITDGVDEKICQEKTKPEPRDLYYRGQAKSSHYCFRMSFSHENPIDCPPTDKGIIIVTRQRQRQEFDTGNGYIYVFTEIDETQKDRKSIKKYEVEIEFDLQRLSVELIQKSLWELMGRFLISNVPERLEELVIQTFDENMKKFKPVKPINLNDSFNESRKEKKINEMCPLPKHDINNIFSRQGYPYQVTNKLDGERCYLIFKNNQVFSIQERQINGQIVNFVCLINVEKVVEKVDKISIVDAEYFNGKYYFFDCYIHENRPVYQFRLTDRLDFALQLSQKNNDIFVMKKFSKLLPKDTRDLLATLNRDENDGLVYTPENPDLNLPIYKWKFPEKMSIDFQVKKIKQTPTENIYTLNVSGPKSQIIPFNDGKAIFSTPLSKLLTENGIYEFMFNKSTGKFVLHRERNDKTSPNYICTAIDVWKDIINPFTDEKLKDLFKPLRQYRKYHNFIKQKMISDFCIEKTILDLGVGNGGDLPKYKDVKVKKVFGVEPYAKNFNELKRRISEDLKKEPSKRVMDINFTLLEKAAQETDFINESVGVDGVDIVTSFFSLSFFFFPNRDKDLINLVETISQNLKEGGYFIGTTIDGESVKNLLVALKDNIFDFGDGFIRLNKDQTVTFEVKDTIVETQQESLVDFKRLKDELGKVGIVEYYTVCELCERELGCRVHHCDFNCKICDAYIETERHKCKSYDDEKCEKCNRNMKIPKHKCEPDVCKICKCKMIPQHTCKYTLDIEMKDDDMDNRLQFFNANDKLTSDENILNSLYRRFIFKKRKISKEISTLCDQNTFANLLTKSNLHDNTCYDLLKSFKFKNIRIDPVPRKDIYNALEQFYFYKKNIESLQSDQFIKWYSVYGTRIDKKSILEETPLITLLLDYKESKHFPILREQFINTIHQLRSKSIQYTNFDNGLAVYKDNTGNVRLLFTDYNAFVIDTFYEEDEEEDLHVYTKILQFLKPQSVFAKLSGFYYDEDTDNKTFRLIIDKKYMTQKDVYMYNSLSFKDDMGVDIIISIKFFDLERDPTFDHDVNQTLTKDYAHFTIPDENESKIFFDYCTKKEEQNQIDGNSHFITLMPIVELNIITHLEDSKRHIVDLLNIADFEQAISLFLQLSKEQKMFRFVIDDFEKVLLPKDAEYKDDVSHNVYEFLFLCDISLSNLSNSFFRKVIMDVKCDLFLVDDELHKSRFLNKLDELTKVPNGAKGDKRLPLLIHNRSELFKIIEEQKQRLKMNAALRLKPNMEIGANDANDANDVFNFKNLPDDLQKTILGKFF